MSGINILDKNTINQIAAGEVIERPASIVKELIENSIDAGADSISCEIKGGGIDLIRITDNGSGIDPDDIRKAFLRHATSKIRDASDLAEVMSLGFRGEALASIAAVAEVELITRCRGSVNGIRYLISGGEELGLENIGCPEGTTFIIRNIFGNVPVRRKFLKTPATEGAYINDFIEKIALSHPEVSIKFINNSRTAIFTTGSNSIKDIVYGIYGREITSALSEVSYESGEPLRIKVSGYIAKPVVARSNRNLEHYYVNGRYIRSNIISKAIEDAYSSFLMQHKYPFTVMHIEIPASTMDVNVHPTKQEVRFEQPEPVYKAVYEAVSQTLRKVLLIPKAVTPAVDSIKQAREDIAHDSVKQLAPEPFEAKRKSDTNREPVTKGESQQNHEQVKKVDKGDLLQSLLPPKEEHVSDISCRKEEKKPDISYSKRENVADISRENEEKISDIPSNEAQPEKTSYVQLVMETDTAMETPVIREETKEEFKKGLNDGYKIIGQVFNTYWIVERGNEMYVIDQHAAHEKIIYERLVAQKDDETTASQILSPAMIVSFTAAECDVVERHIEDLKRLGFTLEAFGGREYSVSTVPLQLYSLNPKDLLEEIVASFAESEAKALKNTITLKERLATCSCKAAVKGNTRISPEEARSLIEQLLKLDNPFNCPHGRPVIINMTKQELEKKFKRII